MVSESISVLGSKGIVPVFNTFLANIRYLDKISVIFIFFLKNFHIMVRLIQFAFKSYTTTQNYEKPPSTLNLSYFFFALSSAGGGGGLSASIIRRISLYMIRGLV